MTNQAIKYLKEVVEALELKENNLSSGKLALEAKQKQIVLDRETLTGRESAFLDKVNGHGKEVERIDKLYALAKKMKAQSDEDNLEMKIDEKRLNKRENEIEDLETKQKELKAREELVESRESEVDEKELIIEKDKQALRTKQEDLDLRAKSIKQKQTQLQRMIEAQKL